MSSKSYGTTGLAPSVELGKGGARVKDNSGVVEARNNADAAYAIVRGADPVGGDDFTTKNYVDEEVQHVSVGALNAADGIDNGDGTMTFAATDVYLRHTTDHTGKIYKHSIGSTTLGPFTDNGSEYVVAEYNGGAPRLVIESDYTTINNSDRIAIWLCWRQGTTIHSLNGDNAGLALANKIATALTSTQAYRRAGDAGLIITESATPNPRTVVVTGAYVFAGFAPQVVLAFNSSTDKLTKATVATGTWTYSLPELVYGNTNYNPPAGSTAMDPNKWAVRWFYRSIGDVKEVFYVEGTSQYNKRADAELEGERTDLPALIRQHCILVGRAVIQSGATSGSMSSAFEVVFPGAVINHDDTANISGGAPDEYNHLTDAELADVQEIPTRQAESGEYGFADNTETSISFDDGTYTFTLTDAGAGWTYYRNGARHTITGNKTVVLAGSPPAAGVYFIYIDATDGTLTASTGAWSLNDTKVPVALVAWNNALTPKYLLADERHTNKWPRGVHRYEHFTEGTQLVSGGEIGDVVIPVGSPAGDDDNTFSLTEAVIADEDLWHTIAALADGDGVANNYSLLYRTAASTWAWRRSPVPLAYTTTGYIEYDNAGTLTPSINNRYVNVYVWLTNIAGDFRIVCVPGRAEFTTAAAAYAEDWRAFTYSGFPLKEGVLLYQLTFATGSAYTTLGKVKLARTPLRLATSFVLSTSAGVGTDHETLSNLLGGDANGHYHLKDTEHTGLTGGGDTTLHTHDGRYFTETELGSTTGGSEGASRIGTDAKANLGGATTVEAAITAADTHVGSTSNPHAVTKTQVGLSNVTNDAQLKRAAGDFASFTAKVTPVAGDIFLIEDSADSNAKKSVTGTQLLAVFAAAAKGVTNGDSHDHNGGDGAQVDHVNLANKGTNTHAQIDSHLGSTSNPHSVTASQAGAVANTIVDAKGDLIGASAADTPARVAAAAGNNYILKSNSAATPGVDWQAPPTRTIWLSAGGATLPTTNPATRETQERATNKNAYDVLKFPYGANTGVGNADWAIAMPDAWDGGTIAATFYYYTTATDGTNNIVWQLKGVCITDAENTDVAWGSAQTVATPVSGTANYLKKGALATPITVAGTPAAGELLHLRVTRDAAHASDNTTLDAYLVGVRLEFTTSGWTD